MKTFAYLLKQESLINLTFQQKRVLEHLLDGKDNAEIAAELRLSIKTVKGHMTSLIAFFKAKSRTDIVRHCMQKHLDALEEKAQDLKWDYQSLAEQTHG